jgi:hypothetical protein
VGELVAEHDEGDDDAVGERKLMARAGAGGAQTLVTSAFKQPGLLAGRPVAGQADHQLAEAARLKAGEDTLAQGRAAQVLRHNNT